MQEKKFYLKDDGTFVVDDYNQAYPFSNFLPAIAGKWGIPMWVFYVNRAQAVVSFGIQDKDNSIMEFLPADKAYSLVSTMGFRTFLRVNKSFYEPFNTIYNLWGGNNRKHRLLITSHDLTIEEENKSFNLKISVNYFTLPNYPLPMLVRTLSIKNLAKRGKINLKVIDGAPRIIPFGERDIFLKNLSRTVEAWMCSEIKDNVAIFRLKVDPKDGPRTKFLEGAHFNCSFYEDKGLVYPSIIIDPFKLFGMDTSFIVPLELYNLPSKRSKDPIGLYGRTPCAFSCFEWELKGGEEKKLYNLFGSVFNEGMLNKLKDINSKFLEEKRKENISIIEKIKDDALCVSGFNNFNQYVRATYLDNVLRGGYPYNHDGKNFYHIFTRKHGDLERDYNKFKILPSYFSEGESNYRDLNQNRRIDLFFNPSIGRKNIVYFMNFLKMDGYNPLVLKGEKLYFDDEESIKDILKDSNIEIETALLDFMKKGFYLGELFNWFIQRNVEIEDRDKLVSKVLSLAKREPIAKFGEGYWIDHWYYNLDLIESFLYFYPDKLKELFWETEFMFWDDEYRVKNRFFRYILKDGKLYQGESVECVEGKIELINSRERFKNFLHDNSGKGKIYTANLFVKLLSLILNKASTFDPYGLGIEMEADKPGWCDSLNGLPYIFGSSLCETIELKRACKLVLYAIDKLGSNNFVMVPKEIYDFYKKLNEFLSYYFSLYEDNKDYLWWDKTNDFKEEFRERTFWGISGDCQGLGLDELRKFLEMLVKKIDRGIDKAKESKDFYPTYFYYEVKDYQSIGESYFKPTVFLKKELPLFLEIAVHLLKLLDKDNYRIVETIRNSELYDNRLKMYRLNANLYNCPLEIGRSRVFPRGWLENESIWLHMEYKYLLELLKNGFYNDFYKDLFNCLVCFFDPQVYGRSILENSSFIVSSAYYDSNLWGKGFVARLSGSTAELLHMWMIMCLGRKPFFIDEDNKLCVVFSPILKKDFFTKEEVKILFNNKEVILPANVFAFKLFSSILVVYHNPEREDIFERKANRIVIKSNGREYSLGSAIIKPPFSVEIRERKVERIDIYF
ncbi:MAG: hypothetical protein NC820_04795 [Candidatus Omnitrophica bacterium]|nr:hypothetical protein [Candidatus Omnitrophota bacterium]